MDEIDVNRRKERYLEVWSIKDYQRVAALEDDYAYLGKTAVFTRDGRYIISASGRIWDATSFEPLGRMWETTNPVRIHDGSLSHDGQRIAVCILRGDAFEIDVEIRGIPDGRLVGALRAEEGDGQIQRIEDLVLEGMDDLVIEEVRRFASLFVPATYSSDDHYIITAGARGWRISVWNASHHTLFQEWKNKDLPIRCIQFSPDGSQFMSALELGHVRFWNMEHFRKVEEMLAGDEDLLAKYYLEGEEDHYTIKIKGNEDLDPYFQTAYRLEAGEIRDRGGLSSAVYSPDGERVMMTLEGKKVKIFDVQSHELKGGFAVDDNDIFSICYSPDGRYLTLCGSDGTVKIWNTEGHQLEAVLHGPEYESCWAAVYRPDGQRLLAMYHDAVVIWNVRTGKPVGRLENAAVLLEACYSPDGNRIAGYTKNEIVVFDPLTGQCVTSTSDYTRSGCWGISYSKDGRYLLRGSTLRDANTLQVVRELETKEAWGEIKSSHFSPDGERILLAMENQLVVYDAHTCQLIKAREASLDDVDEAIYSPDRRKILTVGDLHEIWDAETLRKIGSLKYSGWKAAYSPDGKVVAAANNDVIRIYAMDAPSDEEKYPCVRVIRHVSQLEVIGCDFRHVHPDTNLAAEQGEEAKVRSLLRDYGGIV